MFGPLIGLRLAVELRGATTSLYIQFHSMLAWIRRFADALATMIDHVVHKYWIWSLDRNDATVYTRSFVLTVPLTCLESGYVPGDKSMRYHTSEWF